MALVLPNARRDINTMEEKKLYSLFNGRQTHGQSSSNTSGIPAPSIAKRRGRPRKSDGAQTDTTPAEHAEAHVQQKSHVVIAADLVADPNISRKKRRRTGDQHVDNTATTATDSTLIRAGVDIEPTYETPIVQDQSQKPSFTDRSRDHEDTSRPVSKGMPSKQPSTAEIPQQLSGDGDIGRYQGPTMIPPKIEPGNTHAIFGKQDDLGVQEFKGAKACVRQLARVVVIPYNRDDKIKARIGAEIAEILRRSATAKATYEKPKAPATTVRDAATKPWWLRKRAKSKLGDNSSDDKSMDSATATTDFHDAADAASRIRGEAKAFKQNANAIPAGFGSSNLRSIKHPGMKFASWPWQGVTHIRGSTDAASSAYVPDIGPRPAAGRAKYHNVQTEPGSILDDFSNKARIGQVRQELRSIDPDTFLKTPGTLRVPRKEFISGTEVQKCVHERLKKLGGSHHGTVLSSDDELQGLQAHWRAHPAISQLLNSLPGALSAFDRFECEAKSWTHKYAPRTAASVLQPTTTMEMLKNWLKAQVVVAVNSGSNTTKHDSAKHGSGDGNKRTRQSTKLDDFIVSSESEDERDDDAAHVVNAILITGPNGCGKSASVYAVAKELGFEVFEINAGSRRSGKDIMEKVGDMVHNHQVQKSKHVPGTSENIVSTQRQEEVSTSGRQGKMESFFKQFATKTKPATAKIEDARKANEVAKKSSPTMKQSLILLEEVDLLYDEDKNFWPTVLGLIATSKRPIIMTCQDEAAALPKDIPLHTVIRLTPPPLDLASNYLLLMAAHEGHLLDYEAVEDLYESRSLDLRASITELNFWCQFAVGDRRAGLDWLEPRWPIGVDLDKHGQKKRVVSGGTYCTGMGKLSKDSLRESHEASLSYENILEQAWQGWRFALEAQDLVDPQGIDGVFQGSTGPAALNTLESHMCSYSDIDIISGGCLSEQQKHAEPDTSIEPITSKVRCDYPTTHPLLETPLRDVFHDLRLSTSLWLKAQSIQRLEASTFHGTQHRNPEAILTQASDTIRQHILQRSASSELKRRDISIAFDPISNAPSSSQAFSTHLDPSCFDRPMTSIVNDVAPYVRSIVRYDEELKKERLSLSGLLSLGGPPGHSSKRMRTTRSALSALEGGQRTTVRRERWFGDVLKSRDVERTGGDGWAQAASQVMAEAAAVQRGVADYIDANRSTEALESGHSRTLLPEDQA